MKKLLTMIAVLGFITAFAQQKEGIIKGKVLDGGTAEPVPFANISLLQNGVRILGTTSDFDGFYRFAPLDTGTYEVMAAYVGYQTQKVTNVVVSKKKITTLNISLQAGVELEEVNIIGYRKPLFEADQTTTTTTTISKKSVNKMACRSVADIANITGNGVTGRDNGTGTTNVRGARTGASVTYIDGIKVIGTQRISQSSIEEISISTSGVSAQYENNFVEENTEPAVISGPPAIKYHAVVDEPVKVDPYYYRNEYYQEIADNPFELVGNTPLSTFSIDVDKASYANTRRYINDGYFPPASAVRIEEMINYFNYDYPQPKGEHPFSISTEFADCPWNKERKLALIGIQGKDLEMEEAPKSNLVFLIDVSGSMASADKLDLLQDGLSLLVNQLRKEDRIAIVVYAGAAGVVLPSTSGENKFKIKKVLHQLHAGGSTAGGQGIQLAYDIAQKHFIKNGNNRIILATDGDFNVGISDQQELVKLIEEERDKGIFLSILGFGTGNLQDYKMEQMADKGNGNYNYIDNILEAKKVLVSEMGGTLFTIAKDVKVQAEFNPEQVKAYRLIGYVNRNLNDRDFNDDTKDAGELGAGHSVTVLYEIIPANSEELTVDIDPLKYQQNTGTGNLNSEVLTVKFRYKKPDGDKSILLSKVLSNEVQELSNASLNLQFSAAVASFGMLLRQSESVKELGFKDVVRLAKQSKGEDEEGYRSEFIRLVETAELLK